MLLRDRHLGYFILVVLLSCFLLSACKKTPSVKIVCPSQSRVETTVANVNAGTVRAEKASNLAFGGVGRVSRLNISLGSMVKKDDILAEIENSDLAAMLSFAQSETKRLSSLLSSGGSAATQVDKAESQKEELRGMYEKTLIKAPFDGLIVELNLEVGQLSQITTINPEPLMKIVDISPRYIRTEIDEVDLSKIQLGQNAKVKILAVRREPFKASVRKIIPYISTIREQDRTSQIELNVDSEGVLLPVGASADVEVIIAEKDKALSLPTRAVMGHSDARFVYCYSSGQVLKKDIQIGLYNYDRSEISEGLREIDQVILPAEGIELSDGIKVDVENQKCP